MDRARYSVREEVKDTIEAFYRALSSRNLKALSNLWAHEPYAAVAGRTGDLQQGWEQVYRYWEQRFRRLDGSQMGVRLLRMSCHAVGDVAWVTGMERRTVTEGDQSTQEDLRMTAVLERKGTGWEIVLYHVSMPKDPPKELAAAS